MISMGIYRVATKDIKAILFIINRSNSVAYRKIIPPKYFKEPILTSQELLKEFEKMTFYVYEIENAAIGVAALKLEDGGIGQIRWVYVLPGHQRKGFGTSLIEHIENEALNRRLKKLRVLTSDSAYWAKNFYSKLGYKMIGKISKPWGTTRFTRKLSKKNESSIIH